MKSTLAWRKSPPKLAEKLAENLAENYLGTFLIVTGRFSWTNN